MFTGVTAFGRKRLLIKPSLDAVMSQAQIEKKVTDYLRKSQALEYYWQRPLLPRSCKLKWSEWRTTPNNPRCCANYFRRWKMIPSLSRNVWPDQSWRNVC